MDIKKKDETKISKKQKYIEFLTENNDDEAQHNKDESFSREDEIHRDNLDDITSNIYEFWKERSDHITDNISYKQIRNFVSKILK